ncbi:MAG TPA: PAS domain-containing sensor histidine kinase [Longimicrobiales bacterium]|nr:PAS domain-containing sensor histidine kinase [Longimicrobiales bacterium]
MAGHRQDSERRTGALTDAREHPQARSGDIAEWIGGSDEVRLRRIVDQVADGLMITSADGVIVFVNSAAESLFGRSAEDLLDQQFGFPVVAGEGAEIEVLRPSGPAVIAELRVVSIDWEGEAALLISLRDITERKHAEQQARDLAREQAARAAAEAAEERYRRLAQDMTALAEENAVLYDRAMDASRAKSEFLAVVSHELRTPLNAIIGYTDLLESGISGPVNETQAAQLKRVKASSRHLIDVVDDILTFSRLETGREQVHPEPVDFAALMRDAVELVQPIAEQKNLPVHIEEAPDTCMGEADARRVRQILLNLLSNAVKFTDTGGVWITGRLEGEEVVFRVRDSGIGIPESQLDWIWEPFSQVEASHTRKVGGTGLGLSVVLRLARLMGGDATVQSSTGEGSTFTVRLPRYLRK